MARRKPNKPKKNKKKSGSVKEKTVKKETKKVGRPKLFKTKMKERFQTKEDIYEFGKEFAKEWPSFWCEKNDQFINMLACIHRKYVFKYHTSCSKCTQIFKELENILGDRVEEI